MKPEIRDAFLDGIEEVFRKLGEDNYDAAFDRLIRNTERFLYGLNLMRTKERAAALIDIMPDPTAEEELVALSFGKFLPQLAAMTVSDLVQKFVKEVAVSQSGRPKALQHDQRAAMVKEMGRLITEGYTAVLAKRYAARKFKVSFRTAERAWQKRAEILDGERHITLQEAKDWFSRLLQQPGPLLPEISTQGVGSISGLTR